VPPRRRTASPGATAPGPPGRDPAGRLRAALAAGDSARAADAAVEVGPAARDLLPDELRPGFDTVQAAFARYEAGEDEAAREALQAVGLASPFLEWKLLLRGLIACAACDDARAVDNWSRLKPERRPARLAAPLRFALDAEFRRAQPAAAQAQLQAQGDRLLGGLLPGLRELQRLLARTGRLANAFRQAEALLPTLRAERPDLVSRLANCCYWAIIQHGDYEDLARYRKLFGPPTDDPQLARLEALACEARHSWAAANKHWQRYEKSLADLATLPAADRDRARALVWCRLGRNAAEPHGPPYGPPGRRKPAAATEAHFRKAVGLAPDLLEAHEDLFQFMRERGKPAQALAAGRRLLERFPDHGPTLEALADLCHARGDDGAALEYARRALAGNPLDRRLRGRVADAHRARARAGAAAGDLAAARADLDAALALRDGRPDVGLLTQSAALAFRAGDADAAEERLRQANAAGPPLAAAYALLAESARLKLPRALKQRFEGAFTDALAAEPTAPAAVALAGALLDQQRQGGTYLGQKTHARKVQTFVEAAAAASPGEADLVRLCEHLHGLEWWTSLRKAAAKGQRRFPRSPFFPYFEAAAHLGQGRDRSPAWKVEPLLEKARRLAEAAPPDGRLRDLLRDLDAAQRRLAATAPLIYVLNDFFDLFDEE
jgi:tetratricopeptide (TPR) repeat protein